MTTPVKRYVFDVSAVADTANTTASVITFTRPTGPTATLPAGPFNTDPFGATASTPNAQSTVFPNLLSFPAEDYASLAGAVSAKFNGTIVNAAVFVRAIEMVDSTGTVIASIYNSGGLNQVAINDASVATLLGRLPLGKDQSLRVTIYNNSGGALIGFGIARYDLGVNVQQPEVFSLPASL